LGILIIHLLNIIRVIALTLLAYKAPEYLDFNHTYTFTILVYSVVFILWMIWALKISKVQIQ
jgi:exosortase/archaeosortase family protein